MHNYILFLFELNNYVTSFVVGAIVVPFKYIGNKTSMLFTRYTTLIFFHLVETFIVSNKTDVFFISETFLDSSVDNIYGGLNINGYILVRSDHSSNTKRGGVAIYYEDHLPVIRRNDISSLNESIVLEIRLANNKCFLISVYRSPSQSKDQFDEFCSSLNIFISNINDEKPLAISFHHYRSF